MNLYIFYRYLLVFFVVYQIKISHFADQIDVKGLCRNKVSHCIEHKALCPIRTCDVFHCLRNVRVVADDDICTPFNHVLCLCLDTISHFKGIFIAPVCGNHNNICQFVCPFNLFLNHIVLCGQGNLNGGIIRNGIAVDVFGICQEGNL